MREVQTKFSGRKVVWERYIVDELLGQGGFGAVYRVHDRRVKNNVFALKEIVDPNERQRESFTLESAFLQRLDHPHLPRVYRSFEDEKHHRLYMLMDYINGPNLEHLRVQQPEQRFTFAQTLKIMAPIIEATIYLHTQTPPIIHRDIKPANIIVPNSGHGTVLVDLGIAKVYDLHATTTTIRHCSPGYGAPEQYLCNTNPQTDVYGLSATFYTLLTGKIPIDSLHRITSLSTKGVDPLEPMNELVPEIPVPVADIIQRALAIDSNKRFPSVEAFWETFKECCGTKVTDSLSLDGLVGIGLVPASRTRRMTLGRGLAFLPTMPLSRERLLQPRPVVDTGCKRKQILLVASVSLIILALRAGAIFAKRLFFPHESQ